MITFQLFGVASNGTVTAFNPLTGAFTFTPTPGFLGVGSFQYEVFCDAGSGPVSLGTATVTININGAVTVPDQRITYNGNAVSGNMLTNDTVVCSGTASVQVTTPPTSGTLSGVNPTTGAFTYTPNVGFFGVDTFQYTVFCDTGSGPVALAVENVTIYSNGAVLQNDTYTTTANTPVAGNVSTNDTVVCAP
jgi:Bacterial Ig domain